MMREFFFNCPPAFSIAFFTAQLGPPSSDTIERMGFSGLGILTTIFLWKHFNNKEVTAQAAREKREMDSRDRMIKQAEEDKAERNQLLHTLNELNKQQLEDNKEYQRQLMQSQKDFLKAHEDSQRSIKELLRKGHCPKVNSPD